MDDIIIIGSGAAGLSAAVYALRAGKNVRAFENNTFGGQINFAPNVENYPSIKKISGSEFAANLLEQAMDLGLQCEYETVEGIEKSGANFKVITSENIFEAKAVIIASGVKHRRLMLEREDEFSGAGVSYCAVCDGAFYKGGVVAVAGGGDTAFQEAVFLSHTAKQVYIIHRREEFRAEKRLIDSAKGIPNISFITNAELTKLNGGSSLESVTYKDKISGEEKTLAVNAVFAAIGHEPQNAPFKNIVRLDCNGFIDAGEDCITSTPGIFAAGDCRRKSVRQLTTAVGDGAVAGLAACKYADKND